MSRTLVRAEDLFCARWHRAVRLGTHHWPEGCLCAGCFTRALGLHPPNQLITLGLGAPLSLGALTAGAVLTPYPAAAGIVFLPLIYLAVLVAFGAVVAVWCCPGFMTASRVLVRLRRTFDGRLSDLLRDTAALLTVGQDDDTLSLSLERRLDRLHAADERPS
ncbi:MULTISPECIES: hypothetical protein [unclassified Streptomyces]|uniref:hypothetical protein n=1 Tax=unclassified Streptomyces TaxID=2593676 RepID=UPI00336A3E04